MDDSQTTIANDLMEKLKDEKHSANEVQLRKHEDWNDNYELYRNKVKTNRLTQRQAVNIPLMKETIKTLLSKIDDAPSVDWKEMGGDEDKEILFQEMWDSNFKENKLELVDILDKKNVLLYGLGVKKLNIGTGGVDIKAMDIYDIAFDPLMLANDIESSRFIIHQNIFKTVREVLADDRYSEEGKRELKMWVDSEAGITQSADNKEQYAKKMQRLEDMGVQTSDFPLWAGGDRIVNLTEHYTSMWNVATQEWERRVVVYADEEVILLDEPLKDLIGVEFWPFVVWAEDPETNDIYPDSVADLVRTPNKVMNVWFSQLIENRTLKNFQMHWFLPGQNYTPQTYTPGPGVMLPAPPGDDINKVIKPVEVNGLDDTMPAIAALTNIVERGTGATALDKGQSEGGSQTLGEVEIIVGKSVERAVGMAKFYRMSWYETAFKWYKLMHENAPKVLTLYKQGKSGRLYTKKIMASDWKSKQGYEPVVASTSEQEQNQIATLQKWNAVLAQNPDNPVLRELALKRSIQLLDVTPDELKQIEEASSPQPVQNQTVQGIPQQPQAQQQDPESAQLTSEIEASLANLGV